MGLGHFTGFRAVAGDVCCYLVAPNKRHGGGGEVVRPARVVAARCSPKWRRVDNTNTLGYNSWLLFSLPWRMHTRHANEATRWGQNYRNYVNSALCYLGNSAQLDSFGLRPRPSSVSCSSPHLPLLALLL